MTIYVLWTDEEYKREEVVVVIWYSIFIVNKFIMNINIYDKYKFFKVLEAFCRRDVSCCILW